MLIFQFPNGFSHRIGEHAKKAVELAFQFPNGFSQRISEVRSELYKPFNSLTDSHEEIREGSRAVDAFQFPNGFSHK